jgi:uncharacterized protein
VYHPVAVTLTPPFPGLASVHLFLTAEWCDLVILNYEVDAALLQPHVPRGTELDSFDGRMLLSLVGFRFRHTRFFGALPVPFHSDFDEVNLRFYVRRLDAQGELRRGVVFVREIVGKRAVVLVARLAYNENYVCCPVRHRLSARSAGMRAEYEWRHNGKWLKVRAEVDGDASLPAPGSLEQFVSEHYWGYSRQRDGSTKEYQVTHPRWRVWRSANAGFEGDGRELYGPAFGGALAPKAASAFIADGSPVRVFSGLRIA